MNDIAVAISDLKLVKMAKALIYVERFTRILGSIKYSVVSRSGARSVIICDVSAQIHHDQEKKV